MKRFLMKFCAGFLAAGVVLSSVIAFMAALYWLAWLAYYYPWLGIPLTLFCIMLPIALAYALDPSTD